MGCDGGTIPRRGELVRQKQKQESKDKDAERACRWRHCSISQQPLERPIVTCRKGRLYNKTAVIECLLDKTKIGHIKSLKDVRELKLTVNPSYDFKMEENKVLIGAIPGAYICPITALEMTGKYPFVALWTCGCVFSERALRELKSSVCGSCSKFFSADDIVVLNSDTVQRKQKNGKVQKRQLQNCHNPKKIKMYQ